MATLASLRSRLQACKIPAAGQTSRQFLPEGSLEELLRFAEVTSALADPAFQIPSHKLESTAQIILAESQKVFAILVDLRLEYALRPMIENDCLDSRLPLSERDLKDIVPEAAGDIAKKQWEYIAYTFRKGTYQRKIPNERILPFLQEPIRISTSSYFSPEDHLHSKMMLQFSDLYRDSQADWHISITSAFSQLLPTMMKSSLITVITTTLSQEMYSYEMQTLSLRTLDFQD